MKLTTTFECLDYLDNLLHNKRPAAVGLSFEKETPEYVFYKKYAIPVGSELIVKDNHITCILENKTKIEFDIEEKLI